MNEVEQTGEVDVLGESTVQFRTTASLVPTRHLVFRAHIMRVWESCERGLAGDAERGGALCQCPSHSLRSCLLTFDLKLSSHLEPTYRPPQTRWGPDGKRNVG